MKKEVNKKNMYSVVRAMIKEYFKTLDINEVRKEFTIKNLLNQNAKLAKSNNSKYIAYGLELLPAELGIHGRNDLGIKTTCQFAGLCKASCIVFSGIANTLKNQGIKDQTELTPVLKSRARKMFLYLYDNDFFMRKLELEINKLQLDANFANKHLAIRLNVFQDLLWDSIIKNFPNITFYDYTKDFNRVLNNDLDNYHLTFSVNEKTTDSQIKQLIKFTNVSIVFKNKLPDYYLNIPVINGDKHDLTFLPELKHFILGLKNKQTLLGKIESNFMR